MSRRAAVVAWTFTELESRFIWACLLISAFPLPLWYWHPPVVFEVCALVFQLVGLAIALLGVLDLRKKFGAAGGLFSAWWARAPWRKPTSTTLKVDNAFSGSYVTSCAVTLGRGKDMQTDIDNLWANFQALTKRAASTEQQMHTQKHEQTQAIAELRDSIQKSVTESRTQVKEAVVGNPFDTLYGIWVVVVATLMQLFHVVYR